MILPIPSDLEQFVQQEVASGRYSSPEEVVSAGLRMLRDSEAHREQLRREIQRRVDRLEGGEHIELDDESLGTFFDEIEREVQEETASGEG